MVKHIAASLGMVALAASMSFAAQSGTASSVAPKSVTQSDSGQKTTTTKTTTKKHHRHHKKTAAQKSSQTPAAGK